MSISSELLLSKGVNPYLGCTSSGGDKLFAFNFGAIVASNLPARAGESTPSDIQQMDGVVLRSYLDRILEIKQELEDDGETLCLQSALDFWSFAGSVANLRRGGLAARDDGILRAIWDNASNDYVGLEFHGEQRVLYAFFKNTGRRVRDSMAGWTQCSEVMGRIKLFGLTRLLLL